MKNQGIAAMAAELQATKSALQAARKELEAVKNNHGGMAPGGGTSAAGSTATSSGPSIAGRYALLTVIGMLAAWQVYVTIQLNGLIH